MTLEAAAAIAAMQNAIRHLEADSTSLISWQVVTKHRTLDLHVVVYLRGSMDHLPIGGKAAVTFE